MARGWESKSVEAQQELSATARPASSRPLDRQVQARQLARADLDLSRTRVQRELAAAVHPRHREQLEAALRHLNEKIAELDGPKAI